MSVNTSAGTTLEIGGTGDIESESGWELVNQITSLGEFGRVFNEITFEELGTRDVLKFKGTRNDGNIELQLGRNVNDDGQAALLEALDTDFDYNFRVTLNDEPPEGGSRTQITFKAKVMSFTTNVGDPNSVTTGTVSLGIQTGTIDYEEAAIST